MAAIERWQREFGGSSPSEALEQMIENAPLQPREDDNVLKLEFDNRWEGPGDAFQSIVEGMAGWRST